MGRLHGQHGREAERRELLAQVRFDVGRVREPLRQQQLRRARGHAVRVEEAVEHEPRVVEEQRVEHVEERQRERLPVDDASRVVADVARGLAAPDLLDGRRAVGALEGRR